MTRAFQGVLALTALGVVRAGGVVCAEERAKIRLIVLPGSQWYAVEAMKRGGFFDKHNLEIARRSPPSLRSRSRSGKA